MIQSAIVKHELHHNVKKDIQLQTRSVLRRRISATVASNSLHGADESLREMNGWMMDGWWMDVCPQQVTDIALEIGKLGKTSEA